jgi:hypothetical protein
MAKEEHAEAKITARGNLDVNVRSGKTAVINVPLDWSEIDTLDLISYLSAELERQLYQARGGSKIVIPKGPLRS